MILKKIKIKNIRSYKEAEIIFPNGSTLLSGDIGSGKTSILLAIEFALFGLQPGQKANSILRNNESEANVILEMEIDEKKIIIERGLKKSGKSINQTDVSITIGLDKTEGSVTEIKNKILNLLEYPEEFAKKTNDLYRFTVYTPQEEMKQIILESSDTRLNTLRHIFGIDKYKKIEENLEILTSKIRQEIRIKESQIGNLEGKQKLIEEKKQVLKSHHEKVLLVMEELNNLGKLKEGKQKELEELTKRINEKNKLENEKDKSELTLANKRDLLFTNEREIKNINEQIKNLGGITFNPQEVEITKTRIKSQEQILKDLNENYIQIRTSLQSNDSKTRELTLLKDKIASLDKCTACLQVVNEEHKKNIVSKAEQELIELRIKTSELMKNKTQLDSEIEQTRKLIDSLKQSLSQMEILKIKLESVKEKQTRLEFLEKNKQAINNDIILIKKHIQDIEQLTSSFEIYNKEYELKNLEFQEISNKERRATVQKIELEKEVQFAERQIKELENEILVIQETAKKLNYMKELEFWLNNKFLELILFTEKNVMLKLREDFSKLFSGWFSVLVQDTLVVRLDEGFSPVIMQNDYELDYTYLSGGERTAIALAYRLALNQTINSILSKIKTRDLVILDEPTDGFSETQLDRIRDILSQLNVKQLILVSHEQKIESFVDNIIRFKKQDGITLVENP